MIAELVARFARFLEAERHASHYTIRNYTTDLREFGVFLQGQGIPALQGVDRGVVRDYLGWLLERKVARGSIARKLSALRTFFRYLLAEGIVPVNPLAQTISPKKEQRLPSFLTQEEMGRLLAAPDPSTPQGLRDQALLELLYASGLRVSELVGLDLEQVDLELREVRAWGKRGKMRAALMGVPAAHALGRYIAEGRPQLAGGHRSQALFLNADGGRLTARQVQRLLQKYADQAGLDKGVHPHLLRHTFATHLLDGGADLRVVQELLGHASLTSTQVYTHISQSHARRVYSRAHPRAGEERSEEDEDTGHPRTQP